MSAGAKSARPGPLHRLVKGPSFGWNLFLAILLVAEFTVFGLKDARFLRLDQLLRSANTYVLPVCFISIFVTFVMITGGIDIQAGSIVGLTSILIGIFWLKLEMNVWMAVALAVVVAGLCGALTGFIISYCRVQAMVATLGGSFLYKGLALLVAQLFGIQVYNGLKIESESFKAFTKYKVFGIIPLQILLLFALFLVACFLLHRSKYGRKIFLVGVNPCAAEYSGINTRLVVMSTYILTGLAAGVTGAFMTSFLSCSAKPDYGSDLTMSIITACVLGGTLSTGGKGSVIGTALAAIFIGYLRYGLFLCFNVDKSLLDIPVGLMLVFVMVARALFSNPAVIAFFGRLRERLPAGKRNQAAA